MVGSDLMALDYYICNQYGEVTEVPKFFVIIRASFWEYSMDLYTRIILKIYYYGWPRK